jgi:YidC/Oxa1 family membrane protein insertase
VIDAIVQLGTYIMTPLYYLTSFVLLAFHQLWGGIFGPASGASWVLSIIGLTVVIRAALIPLFVKQIKSSRNMQLLQPKVKELQKKYGHDREKLAAETMALYKETGTNPFASCLPILLQMPIFLALFRLINSAAKEQAHGFMSHEQAVSFGQAELFGRLPLHASFTNSGGLLGVQIVAAFLVLAMTATTFTTQRQLMAKNMPKDALTGPYAQQQKMLLYVLPVVFAVGGVAFPIGVLFYWTTTNLWTMGQQFYVIRRNPAPGTPAYDAKVQRDRAKGRVSEEPTAPEGTSTTEVKEPPRPPRQQPKRQSKQQRKKKPGAGSKPGNARNNDDDGTTEGKTA